MILTSAIQTVYDRGHCKNPPAREGDSEYGYYFGISESGTFGRSCSQKFLSIC